MCLSKSHLLIETRTRGGPIGVAWFLARLSCRGRYTVEVVVDVRVYHKIGLLVCWKLPAHNVFPGKIVHNNQGSRVLCTNSIDERIHILKIGSYLFMEYRLIPYIINDSGIVGVDFCDIRPRLHIVAYIGF